ncbi:alginate lyase family protein [Burkholderia cepacia]
MDDIFDPNSHLVGISRRTFLYSFGALAVTACGPGRTLSEDPVAGRAARANAKVNAALASAATGDAPVTTSGAFVHPGLLHTQPDFDRMAQQVAAQRSPCFDSWKLLIANSHSSLGWTPRPQTIVYRGGSYPQNYPILYNDIAAAYACALRWKVSGDNAYAEKAVQIMNAWASTLQQITGDTNGDLAAGIYGYELANAGEIMRGYTGWAAADFASFQTMMRHVFYPINVGFLGNHNGTDVTHYWANWDLCNIASMMAIGVLCDDRTMFDDAVNYFLNGEGNGAIAQAVYFVHPGHLGQWQESGRDQGHNTLGIALGGAICEMAWNQGVDLYGYDNNRFLAGAEYVAKANLKQADGGYPIMPYVPYANVDTTQSQFSTSAQGNVRPCWALVYNHFVNRRGLSAPWSMKFALAIQPEGGGGNYGSASGGYDQLGYGTLTCIRDGVAPATAPTGLTAWPEAGRVVLSWWGVANGTSYDVKRAASVSGPYTTIMSGVIDPLTYTDDPSPGVWYYVVSARTPSGESADSAPVTAVTTVQLHTRLMFDEESGTTAADATGNGHAATLIGGAKRVAGRAGNALSLNGATGYLALRSDIMTDVSDFTIAAWVFWNGNGGKAWSRIFDFGAGIGRYMFLTPRNPAGVMRFAISVNGWAGELFGVTGNTALPTNRWAHVAVTLSGATSVLYLDGNTIGSAADVALAPWRIGHTAQNWIGRSQYPANPWFDGLIDEFRIYRGALTADEIAELARA